MNRTEQYGPTDAPGAAEIESALVAIPGVVRLYPSGSVVSRAAGLGAALIGAGEPPARVRVAARGGAVTLAVSLGVSSSRPVPETVDEVARAIELLYSGTATPAPLLRLTVVHVDDSHAER